MPWMVRSVADERDGLLAFLAAQRNALRIAVHGLTDEQAASKPSASGLSLAGLIKHVARTERRWIVVGVAQRALPELWPIQDWDAEFRIEEGEAVTGLLDMYEAVAEETESIVAEIPDLGMPVPVPDGAPWVPDDAGWSARWVLLHLIEETARHAGHADIIRESLDGATAFPLMAAAEGLTDPFADRSD
ncbi:MAG: DinB family protein [Egibacteraceae bacterium]